MKKFLFIVFGALLSITMVAQDSEKTITLVVNGEAATKEEATKIALRSAIDQSFGTFVSANTEVLMTSWLKTR